MEQEICRQKEKSILDRCAADVYRDYIRSGYTGEVPTLKDMYRQLMLQPEEEARGLALSSELFINGSLNTFAQPTNVNKKNRIMDYDIRELGEQLMPLGMLVTLDSIFNRVIQNWKEGKTTWIFLPMSFICCSAISTVQISSTDCTRESVNTMDLSQV